MYFLGVTTTRSLSVRLFPEWAEILGLRNAKLVGIDLPVDTAADRYRQVVYQMKMNPMVRGALVTTHKLNLLRAAEDFFDELTYDAALCREVSSIYKRNGKLIGHTVDPTTSGQAMKRFIPDDHWSRHRANLLCLGAGGAAVALVCFFCTRAAADWRPRRILLVDCNQAKLDNIRYLLEKFPSSEIDFELIHNPDQGMNDRLMAALPPHSAVINATGMGKDRRGSPITDSGVFPESGIVWELNYRGELNFLHQARAQAKDRNLLVEDGWYFFLLGWSAIVGDVFDLSMDAQTFERLCTAAETMRNG